MSKFEVGDRVKCVSDKYCYVTEGNLYTVAGINQSTLFLCGIHQSGYGEELFELAWQPKPGEMIEVKDGDGEAYDDWGPPVEFRGMVDGQFVCRGDSDACVLGWRQARPIKATVTIIKESTGEKVEISQESSTSIFG